MSAFKSVKLTLLPSSELRLSLSASSVSSQILSVTVLSGSAEIFGTELGLTTKLPTSSNLPIFTYYGCQLLIHPSEVEVGEPGPENEIIQDALSREDDEDIDEVELEGLEDAYIAAKDGDSVITSINIVNTHAQLEVMRDTARRSLTSTNEAAKEEVNPSPRVLIVGDTDSGKASLMKTLTSYALKIGRQPLVCSINPKRAVGGLSNVEGCLSARSLSGGFKDAAYVDSFEISSASGPGTSPLTFFYGSTDLKKNEGFYKELVERMGESLAKREHACEEKAATSPHALNEASSGLICMASERVDAASVKLHLHTIEKLRINVVIVLGHDSVYNKLSKKFVDQDKVKVIKLPKSGGVMKKEAAVRSASVSRCARSYFGVDKAGAPGRSIITKPLMELDIIKMESVAVGGTMLPVGQAEVSTNVNLKKLDSLIQNSIVGICHPKAAAEYNELGSAESIYKGSIAGFLHVKSLTEGDGEGGGNIVFMSPCEGTLPSNMIVTGEGNLTWVNG
ncbi:hypothetical protein TrST_g5520 [Triparma strigata]|uniref:mRNA cleavage and polyadenylation factor CLP1 n=1 Tax=Triparma strigata TaxID=1606541 RepID=A0A9W7A1G6_9STRA|nr:hypothetical protein TrST_g5520 [Triparma strigata]